MGVREFTGELDAAPVVKEFTGTLDGEEPGLIDRIASKWNAGRDIKPLPAPAEPVENLEGVPRQPVVAERALGLEPTRPVQDVGFAEASRVARVNERRVQRAQDSAAMPSIQPTPYAGLSARDPALALKVGGADIGQAVGKGLRYAGAEQAGQLLQDAGSRVGKEAQRAMSPSGQIAMEGQIFDDDLTAGETPLASAGLQALRSLPSMIAMLPAGAGVSKGITAAGGKTLEVLATRPGWIGFLSRTMPSAVGAGVSEGAIAALQNAAQTEERILSSPLESVRKSPYYAKLMAETDQSQPLPQRERQVRKAIAGIASDEIARRTFVSTGGLSLLLGGGAQGMVIRRMAGQGGGESVGRALVKGARQEAIQEAPQSAGEQYIQNLATQNYLDPTQSATQGVIGAGASGAAVGGLTGGVLGGGARVLAGSDKAVQGDQQPAPYVRPQSQVPEYQAAVQRAFGPAPTRDEQVAAQNAALGADLRATLDGSSAPAATIMPATGDSGPVYTGAADPALSTATFADGQSIAGQVIGETAEGDTQFLGDDGVSYLIAPGEATFEQPLPTVAPSDSSLTRTASWVIRNKETGEVMMETFDPAKVEALNTTKYEAVPILEYLQGVAGAAKAPAPPTTPTPTTREARNGDQPIATPDAEVAPPSAESASGQLPGSANVLAPVATGDATASSRGAEVAAPGVRPASPAGTPSLQRITTQDGQTAHVLASELNSARALLKLHDSDGMPLLNSDGGPALIRREGIAQVLPASAGRRPPKPKPKPKPKPRAAPKSLLSFLKSKGGLHVSEAEDLGGESAKVLNKRMPTLFRKAGMSADAAREVMQQHGWLDGIAEEDQLTVTRDLISKALRGDTAVVKDAVTLLEAEADAWAAEFFATEAATARNANDLNAAIDAIVADPDEDALDRALDLSWDSNTGSMTNEEIDNWLTEETPAEAARGGGVESGGGEAQAAAATEAPAVQVTPAKQEVALPPKGAEEWDAPYQAKVWDAETSRFVKEEVTTAEALAAVEEDIAALDQFRKCLG